MTNLACFMINISCAQKVFKILLVMLAFAITFKGIKGQKKIKIDHTSTEGKLS